MENLRGIHGIRVLIFAFFVAGHLCSLGTSQEIFPFSNYPMYADIYKPTYARIYQIEVETRGGLRRVVWSYELGMRSFDLFRTLGDWDELDKYAEVDAFLEQTLDILQRRPGRNLAKIRLYKYNLRWNRLREVLIDSGQDHPMRDWRNFRKVLVGEFIRPADTPGGAP